MPCWHLLPGEFWQAVGVFGEHEWCCAVISTLYPEMTSWHSRNLLISLLLILPQRFLECRDLYDDTAYHHTTLGPSPAPWFCWTEEAQCLAVCSYKGSSVSLHPAIHLVWLATATQQVDTDSAKFFYCVLIFDLRYISKTQGHSVAMRVHLCVTKLVAQWLLVAIWPTWNRSGKDVPSSSK